MSDSSANPLVSVVVPTRNRPGFLVDCIESVKSQEGVNWELIIVDDCSDSESAAVLSGLESEQVFVLRQPECLERCAARNRGLGHARGRYVMFLDDDDWLKPGALSSLAKALESNPDAVASAGARWAVFVGEGYERRDAHPRKVLKRDVLNEVLFGWIAGSGQGLYRTEAVRSFGGYEDESFIPCEDRLFWMRAASLGPVVLIPDTVVACRFHANRPLPPNIIEIRDEAVSRFLGGQPETARRRLWKLRRSGHLFEQAEEMMSRGNPLRAAARALRAFAVSPRIYFSPLVGEWTLRRLGGRLARRFFPAKQA